MNDAVFIWLTLWAQVFIMWSWYQFGKKTANRANERYSHTVSILVSKEDAERMLAAMFTREELIKMVSTLEHPGKDNA